MKVMTTETHGISKDTATELSKACQNCLPGSVVDLGTGEGASLKVMLEAIPHAGPFWTVDNSTRYQQLAEQRLVRAGVSLDRVSFVHALSSH